MPNNFTRCVFEQKNSHITVSAAGAQSRARWEGYSAVQIAGLREGDLLLREGKRKWISLFCQWKSTKICSDTWITLNNNLHEDQRKYVYLERERERERESNMTARRHWFRRNYCYFSDYIAAICWANNWRWSNKATTARAIWHGHSFINALSCTFHLLVLLHCYAASTLASLIIGTLHDWC